MTLQPTDRHIVEAQLGRDIRGAVEVAHRCGCGAPDVIVTEPVLPDGTPFPTTYYLTCPLASAAVGRLEGAGLMRELQEELADEEVGAAYRAAHQRYLADRRQVAVAAGTTVPAAIAHISAGGMPDRVKCLHALLAQSLACGAGVNPMGDRTQQRLSPWWLGTTCAQRWSGERQDPS
jgi:hypothetical protein